MLKVRLCVPVTLAVCVGCSSTAETVSQTSADAGRAQYSSGFRYKCDQVITDARNDAKRQGGIDPFPVFAAKKEKILKELNLELSQCRQKTPKNCGGVISQIDTVKACQMPGSVASVRKAALQCVLGHVRSKLSQYNEYTETLVPCIELDATSESSFSAKFNPARCVASLSSTTAETARAISSRISGISRNVQCGMVAVHVVTGALERWTAEVNKHWRPGETNIDGTPLDTSSQKEEWRKNQCFFGGNIPSRDWFDGQSGVGVCASGCRDYATESWFASTKQARSLCSSKCLHICNKCCTGVACNMPHAGGNNTSGIDGLCKW